MISYICYISHASRYILEQVKMFNILSECEILTRVFKNSSLQAQNLENKTLGKVKEKEHQSFLKDF